MFLFSLQLCLQGFSIGNIAQAAGNSAGCNEPRNTKDSYNSYMSFIKFNSFPQWDSLKATSVIQVIFIRPRKAVL